MIKSHPTTYNGCRFRSRLEAKWAAFFDLAGWSWVYEPIDLDGWAPDFGIATPFCQVFVEVKPVAPAPRLEFMCLPSDESYAKARAHCSKIQVLLLGSAPCAPLGIGSLLDPPGFMNGGKSDYGWFELCDYLNPPDPTMLWREAGNRTQWRAR